MVNNLRRTGLARNVQIQESVIIGNTSNTQVATDPSGGGMYVGGGAIVRRCTFAFNKARSVVMPSAGGICFTFPIDQSVFERWTCCCYRWQFRIFACSRSREYSVHEYASEHC